MSNKCMVCNKKFKDGWNDFFCDEDHAMKFRENITEEVFPKRELKLRNACHG